MRLHALMVSASLAAITTGGGFKPVVGTSTGFKPVASVPVSGGATSSHGSSGSSSSVRGAQPAGSPGCGHTGSYHAAAAAPASSQPIHPPSAAPPPYLALAASHPARPASPPPQPGRPPPPPPRYDPVHVYLDLSWMTAPLEVQTAVELQPRAAAELEAPAATPEDPGSPCGPPCEPGYFCDRDALVCAPCPAEETFPGPSDPAPPECRAPAPGF